MRWLRVAHAHLVEQNTELAESHVALEQERRRYWELFDASPDAYVVTTEDSRILEANRAASELLNISQRFLVGKPLSVFVCEDRGNLLTTARELVEGGRVELDLRIRPRERAPLQVKATIVTRTGDNRSLHWVLRRAGVAHPLAEI